MKEFIQAAALRLSRLSGPEREAELERIEHEMNERAAVHAKSVVQAEVASLEACYVNARRDLEARQLIQRIASPGCSELLLPLVLDRIQVVRQGDDWAVSARSSSGVETSLDGLIAEMRNTPGLERVIVGATADEKAEHARRVAETLGTAAPITH